MTTEMATKLEPKYAVTLEKVKRSHFYKVVGAGPERTYPGVTGILSMIGGEKTQKLIGWAKKEALGSVRRELLAFGADPVLMEPYTVEGIIERARKKPVDVLEAAADYGTRLHDHCDRVIKGLPVSPEDDLINSVLAFQDWFKSSGLRVILGDTAVASLDHGFGGKFDFLALDQDGRLVIGDFKTSSGIREDYALQVAAYGVATGETYGLGEMPRGLIVRFDKATPTFETRWVRDMEGCFDAFLAAKTLQEKIRGELYL
jgi:hypothetical protein